MQLEFNCISEDDLANLFLELRNVLTIWKERHKDYLYDISFDMKKMKIYINIVKNAINTESI